MIVKYLKLRNFRNYDFLEFYPEPGMNIITGANAQGKTNLLESMVYISLTRSHRISDDRKLIRKDCSFADISCTYDDGIERELEAVIHPTGKTLMIYHQPVKKSSEFVGLLNVVLFAPDDLRIFTDSPKDRRRVMNQEISKVSSRYLLALNRYQSLLKERNLLLKNERVNETLLDTLDEQMAEEEVTIVEGRTNFTKVMNSHMSDIYKELSDDDIHVDVRYKCCIDQINSLYDDLLKMHKENRQSDLEHRVTSNGIHREDLIFQIDGNPVISTASQGQKRMTMLAFKMSLLRYIQSQTGKAPVLLLDDVLSELDLHRQKKLIEMVGKPYQCFITSTEVPSFIHDISFSHYVVKKGRIERV